MPIVVAIVAYTAFSVWNRGREALLGKLYRDAMPIREFLEHWDRTTERVSGTAVFMTSNPAVVPTAFLHNLKHNHVVHERVVFMKVNVEDFPRVGDEKRIDVEKLGKGFHRSPCATASWSAPTCRARSSSAASTACRST